MGQTLLSGIRDNPATLTLISRLFLRNLVFPPVVSSSFISRSNRLGLWIQLDMSRHYRRHISDNNPDHLTILFHIFRSSFLYPIVVCD